MPGLRQHNPQLWAEIVSGVREMVGPWTEDEIASVLGKVRSNSPDELIDAIGIVFAWCGKAIKSGDEEAIATVELWQMPEMPIAIFATPDGRVTHSLDLEKGEIEIR